MPGKPPQSCAPFIYRKGCGNIMSGLGEHLDWRGRSAVGHGKIRRDTPRRMRHRLLRRSELYWVSFNMVMLVAMDWKALTMPSGVASK